MTLIDVDGLRITAADGRRVLDSVSLRVAKGERVALAGASGAGKSTLALAALGIIRPGLRLDQGTVRFAGRLVFDLSERSRRRLRRARASWLSQDPAAALTPTMPVYGQINELLPAEDQGVPAEIARRLAAVGLPDSAPFLTRRPGELSGGQQQRVALPRALAPRPDLLVLDEPTSRLDPGTRLLVVEEIERLQRDQGFATLLISHDARLVTRLSDRLLTIDRGRVVKSGPSRAVRGSSPHRRVPRLSRTPDTTAPARSSGPVVAVRSLVAGYGAADPVVRDVSLTLAPGRMLALVGPSGSGKSTIARCLAGVHRPRSGHIEIDGRAVPYGAADRTAAQRRGVQLIGQDPYSALHPRRRVLATVARPAELLAGQTRAAARTTAARRLATVGLAAEIMGRLPGALSGGERQRVAIARALAAEPDVLICDEMTSSLDPAIADRLMTLLDELRTEFGLSVLVITHDLPLAARHCESIAVLDDGRIVEHGPTSEVLAEPRSPAARALVAAESGLAPDAGVR